MGLNKLEKFKQLEIMPNVFQNFDFHQPKTRNYKGEFPDLRGHWASEVFDNNDPLVLELACGRGEYSVGLAQMEKNKNFIGVDLKGNRIWTGARRALDNNITNIAFLRTKIELIQHFFAPNEVSEIWITFADPFVNHTDANRRLTSPHFLERYRAICQPGAVIHLKTDSSLLYNYTLKVVEEQGLAILESDDNIYRNGDRTGPLSIKTYYEKMHLAEGKTIKYLEFRL